MIATPLIVHAVRQFPPRRGGLEDFVLSLTREQVRQGFDVRVVTANRIFTEPGRVLPEREEMDGFEVRRLPARGSRRYPIMPGFLPLIRDAALVHVHAIDFFYDALAFTQPLHRRPLVATTHGGFFHSGDYSALKTVFFNSVTRLSTSRYAAVVGCSVNDVRLFRPLARQRAVLIENGVNLDKFADAGAGHPMRRLVTIGRFSKNKRLDRLIATMRVLADRHPDWHLDIIGVPYDDTPESLANLIAASGVQRNVTLHVGIPDQEVRELVGKASLFASASTFEGFGLALVEAMSAGLVPVVEGNVTFADFADRHGGAVLTGFADPAVAATAIETAYASLMGEGAHRVRSEMMRIAAGFAWPEVAARYASVYGDVLDGVPVREPAGAVSGAAPSRLPARNQSSAPVLIE